jgi:hypothetical protein
MLNDKQFFLNSILFLYHDPTLGSAAKERRVHISTAMSNE